MLKHISKLKNYLLLIAILLITSFVYADDSHFKSEFDQGIKSAFLLRGKTSDILNKYKPEEVFKDKYTNNPKETNYRDNSDAIKTDGVRARENDPTAKSIATGIDERQSKFHYSKDPNSQEVQNVKKRADDIYAVITGQFGDCTKKQNCTTTYATQECEESPSSTYQYCKKILNIDLIPHQEEIHYPFTARLTVKDHNYAGVQVDLVEGKIDFLGPKDARFTLDGRLPSNLDCNRLQGKVISNKTNASLDYIHFPSCDRGLKLDFHISGGHQAELKIDIIYSKVTYEIKDRWDDQCIGLANSANCTFKEERCVAPQSTHDVQGIPVTRNCWEKEATFQCGSTSNVAACQPLRDQGCEQISSTCKNQEEGGCRLYQQTFRCPIKQCTDVGMICNGQTYCLDGDCIKQQKQADPDFQGAVSALSATHSAAKDFTKFNSIFAGTKKTCDKLALGFLDCCEDKGWGKDHIAQCSQEEKDLKVDKDNLLTVYVGEYCKRDAVGLCVEHRKSYCVFPSKLARIIQDQGRHGQLGINFGDPENANCRGLSREEFAKVDLSKINFSDFYTDISQKAKIENTDELNQRVGEKITVWEKDKTTHG